MNDKGCAPLQSMEHSSSWHLKWRDVVKGLRSKGCNALCPSKENHLEVVRMWHDGSEFMSRGTYA